MMPIAHRPGAGKLFPGASPEGVSRAYKGRSACVAQ
jgi:hypothetical protein